jgi:hypothetical protein
MTLMGETIDTGSMKKPKGVKVYLSIYLGTWVPPAVLFAARCKCSRSTVAKKGN